jgi:CubicO group peptidase (beta-lactamase class C family)
MRTIKKHLPLFLLLVLLSACSSAPKSPDLPRSTPEAQGVSSDSIIHFLDAAANSRNEFHSFMFLRHGKVVAEGWWNPYKPELKHTLYSTSKSFTATAIGFAVSEKKLKVSDKVISFFPEFLPDTVSPNLSELTVKDVLSMSDGQDPDPTGAIVSNDSNWVKKFLSLPFPNKPGSKFLYNSMGTYMLSAIVQKVTGEKVIDYLKPRLFDPLGIQGMDWETDTRGINTGGWGLRLRTEDMAKFGELFLQKGKWNDRQIIPSDWIEEASSAKIQQAPDAPDSIRRTNDWMQGYCYQMWRCRNNAFRGDGAFGQYIIVMPDQDAVIAITSETPDMQDILNLVWNYLLPSMHEGTLAENKPSSDMLHQRLAALALPIPPKSKLPAITKSIEEKTYSLLPNDKNYKTVSFLFTEDSCLMKLKSENSTYEINFGNGSWLVGQTTRQGPNLLYNAKGHFAGLPSSAIAGNFNWKDQTTCEFILRYIESPHHETIQCHFDQDKIKMEIWNSLDFGSKSYLLEGKIIN